MCQQAKFKFELANEVAVLESANFELSNDRVEALAAHFPYLRLINFAAPAFRSELISTRCSAMQRDRAARGLQS